MRFCFGVAALVAVSLIGDFLFAPARAPASPAPASITAQRAQPALMLGSYEAQIGRMSFNRQVATFAAMRAAGARMIRWDVPWSTEEESPGDWNIWGRRPVRAALDAGLRVDALLAYAPRWAVTDGVPSASAYAGFVRHVVGIYSPMGVHTYEIWNEPNLPQWWGRAIAPRSYARLLRAADTTIKSIDPSAEVLSGGLAPAPDTSNGTAYEPYTYLSRMYAAGAAGYFDAVADHPYCYPDLPSRIQDSWNPFAYLPAMHRIMAAHGDGRKLIWLTEAGAPVGGEPGSVTPLIQARTVTQIFHFALVDPYVGPVFITMWQDARSGADGQFGLRDANGNGRPALAAYEAAARRVDARRRSATAPAGVVPGRRTA